MTHRADSISIPLLEDCKNELPKKILDVLDELNISVCSEIPDAGNYFSCEQQKLVLNTDQGEKISPELSFPAGFSAKQPLLRALAPARGGSIIDATAGLAGDSLKLAMVADSVIAIERHPVVYALLVSALNSAQGNISRLTAKISAKYGDAISLIKQLPAADVIYMDPMFPPKRKRSALPPKAVRILKDIVGEDKDDVHLLDIARQFARRRVVVKRPLHAPTLASDPVALHKGKVVRYEVYLPTGKKG